MQIKKITCIQLDAVFPDFGYRFVMPDYGIPLIATILSEAGYDVQAYVEHVKPPDWNRIADSDLVCFTAFTSTAGRVYELAKEIREKLGIPTVIGGTHASYYPESCLDFCDYVVTGEGDETILELVETLSHGGDVSEVPGIVHRVGDRVHRTAVRPGPVSFPTIPDFSLIRGYRPMTLLDIIRKRRIPMLTVQFSRGCPFKCTFCIVSTMFPEGYRIRDIETVIQDMRDKRRYGRTLMFVDNDFAARRSYTKKLLQRIIEEDLDFEISVFARVEIARDDELLSLMRRAGIFDIFQGFESVQADTLLEYKKKQTPDDIVAAIKKMLSYGFTLSGAFVLGADNDTMDTPGSTVDFALEHEVSKPHFFPLWGLYPERVTQYKSIVPWYRSIFRGWAYCDGLFVSHFPLQIPPSKLQQAIIDAYGITYSGKQMIKSLKKGDVADVKYKLGMKYLMRDIVAGMRSHIPFLEDLEQGLYDSDYRLRENVLAERVRKDPKWTFQAGNRTMVGMGLTPPPLPVPETDHITCLRDKPDFGKKEQAIPAGTMRH